MVIGLDKEFIPLFSGAILSVASVQGFEDLVVVEIKDTESANCLRVVKAEEVKAEQRQHALRIIRLTIEKTRA